MGTPVKLQEVVHTADQTYFERQIHMNLLLATVVSCTEESYQVQPLGEDAPLTAIRSQKMKQYNIPVVPHQYVITDRELSPPEMLFRFKRATVIAVNGDEITLADNGQQLLANSHTSLATPIPGDEVVYNGFNDQNRHVIDVVVDGKPAHANQLAVAYFPKMGEYR